MTAHQWCHSCIDFFISNQRQKRQCITKQKRKHAGFDEVLVRMRVLMMAACRRENVCLRQGSALSRLQTVGNISRLYNYIFS